MKVLLSIKPQYAELILDGSKLYEFRRAIFRSQQVKKVIIYASSPVQRVIGEFEIEYILSHSPEVLWQKTMEYAGVEKSFYDDYFKDRKVGHAIKIKKAKRYSEDKKLVDFDVTHAPQSFVYITS